MSIAQTADATLPFDSIFNPDALFTRPERETDLRAELRAMHILALEILKSNASNSLLNIDVFLD